MLTTDLREAILRMSQLPKAEHSRPQRERLSKWGTRPLADARKLGRLGKKRTQQKAPLKLRGSPRPRGRA